MRTTSAPYKLPASSKAQYSPTLSLYLYLSNERKFFSHGKTCQNTVCTKPTPLTEDEVIQLGVEKREIVVGYKVGDTVRIMDGPLTSFSGIVEELDVEKNRVRVTVSMFGRETPVDLELDQVELSTD